MFPRAIIISIFTTLFFIKSIGGYNFLAIFPIPAKSHLLALTPVLEELAKRGHQVHIYTPFPDGKNSMKNVTEQNTNRWERNYVEYDISSCIPPVPNIGSVNEMIKFGTFGLLNAFGAHNSITYDTLKDCSLLVDLLDSKIKYDALVVETFLFEGVMGFAPYFNIPLIGMSPNVPFPHQASWFGLPYNPSYIPHMFTGLLSPMSFSERVFNSVCTFTSRWLYHFVGRRNNEHFTEAFFKKKIPSFEEIIGNISLYLITTHTSINPVRPLNPNVVEIGGVAIKPAVKIPKDIEKFLNESEHGVVYFCMGSLLKGSSFPEEKRAAFLHAFDQIPQRVLWKWEGEELPGKTNKIMIRKWMPQRDILAHPNVRLFISHGGLLGTSEAVYEGVPILGIPIFGDQTTNIKAIEAAGAGEMLPYNDISKEVVTEKVKRLLEDPKYRENAKKLSVRYKDRPMSPLDTAVYWTEYVIRHKGAPHLRSAAVELTWYQYLLLDVIAFLLLVFTVALFSIYYTVKFAWNSITGKKVDKIKIKTN